jgi:Uma2 family endonuclease
MGAIDPPVVMQRHRLTVDEYYRMAEVGILPPDARVELIDGEVIDVAPMKSRHAWAVNRLAARLHDAARGHALVTCQTPLRLGEYSEPEPDLMLVKPRAEGYATEHPTAADVLLLVEVADTSIDYDLRIKLPMYARSGVPEVWIVDLANGRVHFFRRPAAGRYADATDSERPGPTAVAALPGVTIDLGALLD